MQTAGAGAGATFETNLDDANCPSIDMTDINNNASQYINCLDKLQTIKNKLIADEQREAAIEKTEYAKEQKELIKIVNELMLERKYKLNQIQLEYDNYIFKKLETYIPLSYSTITIVSICYYLSVILIVFLFLYVFNIDNSDNRTTFSDTNLL